MNLLAPEILAPLAVGSLITWFFAWLYYEKAGRELKQESAELRRLNQILLSGLENAGLMKIARDPEGNPTGVIVEATGHARGSSTASARSN